MTSNRDNLANLLLDCMETAASPRETAGYLIERGWCPPVREIFDPAELDALPYLSVVLDRRIGLAWQLGMRPDGVRRWESPGVEGWALTGAELLFERGRVTLLYRAPADQGEPSPCGLCGVHHE